MTDFSKRLHCLPLHARSAVEATTKYFVRQALPEVSADSSATELTAVLTKIRQSIECEALVNELPGAERGQIVELPKLAADLAHSRIRRGDIELIRSDLPDHECFQRRDRVWVPSETGHMLSGHTGTFQSYTDPRIEHAQRQARIRLEGDEGETLLPPECLAFAPHQAALEEFQEQARASGFENHEHLRTWSGDDFRLELYDTGKTDHHGKAQLAYELYDEEFSTQPIFSGNGFHASPLDATDSDATVAAVLSFISLQAGDTDEEYFDSYTPEQLKWRDQRAEDLGMLVFHLEERQRWRELHLVGRTKEAVLAVAEYGTVEDLCEVLDMDVFEAYDVVEPLAWEDERLRMLGWEVLRVRNRELVAA